MTPLDKQLKRLVKIGGADYVVALSPDGLKLTQKGHRQGLELSWTELVSGEAALATALQASVGRLSARGPERTERRPKTECRRHAKRSV